MSEAADITEKTSTSQPRWLTIIRIALGFILFWKGINFIRDSSDLQLLLQRMSIGVIDKNSEWIAFLITYLNLLGGLFIAVGLFTKTSSIVQIPILIRRSIFCEQQAWAQPEQRRTYPFCDSSHPAYPFFYKGKRCNFCR